MPAGSTGGRRGTSALAHSFSNDQSAGVGEHVDAHGRYVSRDAGNAGPAFRRDDRGGIGGGAAGLEAQRGRGHAQSGHGRDSKEGDIDWGAVFQAIENQGDRIPSSVLGYNYAHDRQQPVNTPNRLPSLDELGHQLRATGNAGHAPGQSSHQMGNYQEEPIGLRQNWSSPNLEWENSGYAQNYPHAQSDQYSDPGPRTHPSRQSHPFGPGNTELLNDQEVPFDQYGQSQQVVPQSQHAGSRPASGVLNEEETLSLLHLLNTHANTYSTVPSPSHSPGSGGQQYPSSAFPSPTGQTASRFVNQHEPRSIPHASASSSFPSVPGPSRPSSSRRNTVPRGRFRNLIPQLADANQRSTSSTESYESP